jgi:hypothetical protein
MILEDKIKIAFFPRMLASAAPILKIPPEREIRHHRMKQKESMGFQAPSPLSSFRCFSLHILVPGILPSREFKK